MKNVLITGATGGIGSAILDIFIKMDLILSPLEQMKAS